mmetsp:Transcript_65731/g.103411  ORF Transcript_65731/g.103411 Transcript_65731/m.103411 type:complete len:104 (-) Transcript_65731:65-376(-)
MKMVMHLLLRVHNLACLKVGVFIEFLTHRKCHCVAPVRKDASTLRRRILTTDWVAHETACEISKLTQKIEFVRRCRLRQILSHAALLPNPLSSSRGGLCSFRA